MTHAFQALARGIRAALHAPVVLLALVAATVAAAVPFGLMVGQRVQSALAHQPPIDLAAQEIDAEWWTEYRVHAQGLESTFTPTIIGFAAPLDNLSALLDRSPRPMILAFPVLLYTAVWAFLWGGVIDRFVEQRGSLRRLAAAGARHFVRMLAITIAALAIVILLYATVHALLFGAIYNGIASSLASDRNAFFLRVALYLVFGALLAGVSLLADYTRIHVVLSPAQPVRAAFAAAREFMRTRRAAVISLYLLNGLLFASLLIAYGLADRRFGGWRAVVLGQAFIVGRLALRMVVAASEVSLVREGDASRG